MAARTVFDEEDAPHVSDLLHQLGDIPPSRILMRPPLGTATAKDLLPLLRRRDKIVCELLDGVLVAKPVCRWKSQLGLSIYGQLRKHVRPRHPEQLSCLDGLIQLAPGLVRSPDVDFIAAQKLQEHEPFSRRILPIVPELAIEILSEGNTTGEMKRKLKDYFLAGVRLVWIIDPQKRVTEVYTQPDKCKRVKADKPLSGGDVLPGYQLVLQELFDELEEP